MRSQEDFSVGDRRSRVGRFVELIVSQQLEFLRVWLKDNGRSILTRHVATSRCVNDRTPHDAPCFAIGPENLPGRRLDALNRAGASIGAIEIPVDHNPGTNTL